MNGVVNPSDFTSVKQSPLSLRQSVAHRIVDAPFLPPRPVHRWNELAEIKRVTARQFGVTVMGIEGQDRRRSLARPRQVVMWIARRLTSLSTTTIGQRLGKRDHSTVIHGDQRIAELLEVDAELWDSVHAILGELDEARR
jgi:hypothetical protein